MSYLTPIVVSDVDNALADSSWDAVIVIAENFSEQLPESLKAIVSAHSEFDSRVGKSLVSLTSNELVQKRLVLSPTGALNRYYDDVR